MSENGGNHSIKEQETELMKSLEKRYLFAISRVEKIYGVPQLVNSCKKSLTRTEVYIKIKNVVGLSPNGKATDSDSVISRFESL